VANQPTHIVGLGSIPEHVMGKVALGEITLDLTGLNRQCNNIVGASGFGML
jgi:hypothetical protein